MLSPEARSKLREDMHSNQHEIYVISFEEMDSIIKSSHVGYSKMAQASWQKIKRGTSYMASWYSSADDVLTLTKLVGDLGFGAKAYIKTYGGKPHIILKGNPRMRSVLTGTKYGVKNAKVITMGLGRAAAVSTAKSGGIISIVLMTAYRIADYVLTDDATLSQLIGSLATDVVKIGITTGASIGAAYIAGAACFSLAIGPILAVVVVGIGVSWLLGQVDEHYHITEKVIAGLDEMGNDVNAYIARLKDRAENAAVSAAGSAIDYVLDYAQQQMIDFTKHSINRLFSAQPRAFFQ